ncbi:MAG: PH domain-containing protein [Lachnospiraceae bacterium]|nr:PH domain-containing protein [Robinsoniella sp.]MDY3765194.1 PH domain-containing protein [Lachnospiraceae bacterium]
MVYKERKRWVFFGLPFTFTKYTISDDMITINAGLLNSKEDDCYMYKVIDVRLEQSIGEKIFGLGTVVCYGGDVTDPTLKLQHIRHAKEIKDFVLRASETERLKRRTVRTQNITGDFPDDVD